MPSYKELLILPTNSQVPPFPTSHIYRTEMWTQICVLDMANSDFGWVTSWLSFVHAGLGQVSTVGAFDHSNFLYYLFMVIIHYDSTLSPLQMEVLTTSINQRENAENSNMIP
jgi:hypothetical protein